jgi:hypothetical protein
MQANQLDIAIPQYSLGTILLVWLAAAAPMGILGWVVAPALSAGSANPGIVRLAHCLLVIWQFVLVLIMPSRRQRPALGGY